MINALLSFNFINNYNCYPEKMSNHKSNGISYVAKLILTIIIWVQYLSIFCASSQEISSNIILSKSIVEHLYLPNPTIQ